MIRTRLLLVTLAGLVTALPTLAQPLDREQGAPVAVIEYADGRTTPSYPQFNLSFPGGTVAEYFDAIRSIPGVIANISLSPDAQGIPMPPMRLTNVSVSVAVRAVETLTDESGVPIFSTRSIEADDSSTLYAITARPVRGTKPEVAYLYSFPVASLLEQTPGAHMSADALLGAIELLLGMDATTGTRPRVMLHKETSTLIMQANKEQIQAVENLIGGLERDMANRRSLARPGLVEIEDVKAVLADLDARKSLQDEKRTLLEQRLVDTKRLIEQGVVPKSELMGIEVSRHALDEESLELDMRFDQAQRRLSRLTEASEPSTVRTFAIASGRAQATLDATRAICVAMSPIPGAELGPDKALSVTGTSAQLAAIENWLRIQGLLAK